MLKKLLDEHTTPVGPLMGGQVIIGRDELDKALDRYREGVVDNIKTWKTEPEMRSFAVKVLTTISQDNFLTLGKWQEVEEKKLELLIKEVIKTS